MKKRIKRGVALAMGMVLTAGTVGVLAGCGGGKELVVWSFTDEIDTIVSKFKEDVKPDYDIKIVKASTASHHSKLTQALRTGTSAPDVFTVEYAYARNFLESGKLMSLSADEFDMETQAREELYEYTVDFMTDSKGTLRALSWQATPGAFFYRRSVAQEYLGVSEPEDVQPYFETFDKFKETTEKLYNDSEGDVKILSSLDDIRRIYLSNRTTGWLSDENALTLEPQVFQYMEMAKFLQDGKTREKYINGTTEQQESWFNDMANPDIFGYFLPTWGLHYYLKNHHDNGNGYDAAGDWGVIKGPQTFVDGGTWLATRAGTKMKDEAKEFMNYVIFNKGFLRSWATDTGDFLANKAIVNEIKDTYSEPFLNGQNHYAFFADIVEGINIDYVSAYDNSLDGMFKEQVVFYARGEKTALEAIKEFVANTKSNFASWTYPTDAELEVLVKDLK